MKVFSSLMRLRYIDGQLYAKFGKCTFPLALNATNMVVDIVHRESRNGRLGHAETFPALYTLRSHASLF